MLSQQEIGAIAANQAYPYPSESDLADQAELVKLTPVFPSFDELTRLWGVFAHLAHRPSLQYIAGPVLLDADPPQPGALP